MRNLMDKVKNVLGRIARRATYLEAYRSYTDRRAYSDPKRAIGGRWEEIGRLQFDFLVAEGLMPAHTLLDIGCLTRPVPILL